MTTLAALRHKTATLEQETHLRYPARAPDILEGWSKAFQGDERAGLEAFLQRIEPHLGRLESGAPNLSRLTDGELDELQQWIRRGKQREQRGAHEQP